MKHLMQLMSCECERVDSLCLWQNQRYLAIARLRLSRLRQEVVIALPEKGRQDDHNDEVHTMPKARKDCRQRPGYCEKEEPDERWWWSPAQCDQSTTLATALVAAAPESPRLSPSLRSDDQPGVYYPWV